MATINYKEFDSGDIVNGKAKLKYFPAWSDVASDIDTSQQAVINTFFISNTQTGSIEGYYYWNIYNQNPATILDAAPQFSIAYAQSASLAAGVPTAVYSPNITGNTLGLGSEYQNIYPWAALYGQLINTTTNGNSYSTLTYTSASTTFIMENVVVIALSRSRIKDYIDPATWQLNLSGSLLVNLTTQAPVAAGQMSHNIVFGTASGYSGPAQTFSNLKYGQVVGRFYADKGLILLDADQLFLSGAFTVHPTQSAKIDPTYFYTSSLLFQNLVSSLVNTTSSQAGVAVSGSSVSNGSYFKARSIERAQSTHYFCRARNTEFNYTSNPTWYTGSNMDVLPVFVGDPKTFITGIGLFDGTVGVAGSGQLVAIAKTSKPLPKDTTSEALIKVRLDF